MRISPLFPLIIMIAPVASGQTAPEGPDQGPPSGSQWSLGGAVIAREGIYAGEDANIVPIPYIGYEGERFFLRGLSAGYRVADAGALSIETALELRPGTSRDDFGASELAANGVDYRDLEDRKWALDAGVSATLRGRAGELKIEAKTDISDASGGQEYVVSYEYPMFIGGTIVSPTIGARHLSDDMSNYYFGTLDEEVARGAVDYKPGAATLPYVGLSVMRPLNEKWTFFGMAEYNLLPDELTDSPLMDRERDGYASVLIALARSF